MAQVEARAREDGSPGGIEAARQGLLRLIEERYIA
jgi:hypothetical protein